MAGRTEAVHGTNAWIKGDMSQKRFMNLVSIQRYAKKTCPYCEGDMTTAGHNLTQHE